jgi:hypothetical protein
MSSKDIRSTRTVSLEDRIQQLRADIEAIISAKVEAIAKESPGVPIGVIRNLLTARAPACLCVQYLELNGEGRGVREPVPTE